MSEEERAGLVFSPLSSLISIRVSRFSVALIIQEEGTLSCVTPLNKRNVTHGLGEGKKILPAPSSSFGKDLYDSYEGLRFPSYLARTPPPSETFGM